jgi:hypothetical protein
VRAAQLTPGAKHYSGPIRAVTKWETGVEIDLQSAIASQRSRPSKSVSSNPSDGPHGDRVKRVDVKIDDSHEVVVAPASAAMTVETLESGSEWTDAHADASRSEWTSGTESGSGSGSDATVSQGQYGGRRGPLSRGESFGAGTMGGAGGGARCGKGVGVA